MANQRVGAKRRPMKNSAKQSRNPPRLKHGLLWLLVRADGDGILSAEPCYGVPMPSLHTEACDD
jgi:hypothetical protein